jgi:flagellar hook-associated protein 2
MAGSVSSLGIGSNVLTSDIIDQLKDVDKSAIINPIEDDITENQSKQADLSLLVTSLSTFKSKVSTLSDELTYLKRSSSVSGDSVSVSVADGVSMQDFEIDVKNLSSKDIFETNGFESKNSSLVSSDTTLEFYLDGQEYELEVTTSTTLSDLADDINDVLDGKAKAVVLNTGEDNPYKLTLQSVSTGEDSEILFGNTIESDTISGGAISTSNKFKINGTTITVDTDAGNTSKENAKAIVDAINDKGIANIIARVSQDGTKVIVNDETGADIDITGNNSDLVGFEEKTYAGSAENLLTTLGLTNLQEAKDAKFIYNGVTMYRSTNSIDDIVTGVDFTLKEEGISNISITQDTDKIKTTLEEFVDQYNSLSLSLSDLTKYDTDTTQSGTFQGDSTIARIMNNLNQKLFSANEDGVSLVDFGLTLTQDGLINFDEDTFNSELSSNATALEKLFRGATEYSTTTVSGSTIAAGSISLSAGDLTINGVEILLDTTALGSTASENAIALRKAINDADISLVSASLSSDGTSVILEGLSATDIEISGDNSSIAGLSTGKTNGISETFEGVFTLTNDLLSNLFSNTDSILTIYSQQLESQYDKLLGYKEDEQDRLDTKYEVMSARFAAYDEIISTLNSQFQSLQMQIEAYSNGS